MLDGGWSNCVWSRFTTSFKFLGHDVEEEKVTGFWILFTIRDSKQNSREDKENSVEEAVFCHRSRRRHLDAVQRQVTTVCRNEEISVTNVWYLHGCRHSVPDGLMRLTDVMVDGKIVVPAGCRNG
ncbi:hypothetical protein C5167_047610 [Papaver somniferum]|uniref:Uncharacterized protein n=1 Tax=Papaver somniferum TaxID=3469 RepID=A0A4Y7LKQ1_PAPSO|nr:hypothetical protein C5167_047610 [Papaver somniferum]